MSPHTRTVNTEAVAAEAGGSAEQQSERWLLAAGVFGIWLGVYALRSYLAMAVWNLADELPLHLKSVLPIFVHALALLAWPAARYAGGGRPVLRFGLLFAALSLLRQLAGNHDLIAALSSFAAWIFCLWWFAAWLDHLAARGQKTLLPLAAVLAVSLQVSAQTALHGLDIPLLRLSQAWLPAGLLCAGFLVSLLRLPDLPGPDAPREAAGRAAIAFLGAWWFLELSLFANLGRMQETANGGLALGALLVQSGLVLGLLGATFSERMMRAFAGGVLLLVTPIAPALTHEAAWLFVPAHAAGIILLFGACTGPRVSSRARGYTACTLGGVLLFVLLFGFYSQFEAPGFWTLSALLLTGLGLRSGMRSWPYRATLPAGAAAVAVLAVLIAQIPPFGSRAASPGNLRVLSYNIHQGFDAAGLPALQPIADVIASTEADVVALQEVSRGWNLLGGADIVAYLRWRFPDHTVVFVPTNGQLWGNAILSRLPVRRVGGATFTATEAFRYGYAFASVSLGDDSLRVYSVHLSADLQGRVDQIRKQQAAELAAAVPARNSIVAGDFNALPGSPVLATLQAHGLADVAALYGLGSKATWPAGAPAERLDYILATPDVPSSNARLLSVTASDHLPLLVEFVRVPPRRESS